MNVVSQIIIPADRLEGTRWSVNGARVGQLGKAMPLTSVLIKSVGPVCPEQWPTDTPVSLPLKIDIPPTTQPTNISPTTPDIPGKDSETDDSLITIFPTVCPAIFFICGSNSQHHAESGEVVISKIADENPADLPSAIWPVPSGKVPFSAPLVPHSLPAPFSEKTRVPPAPITRTPPASIVPTTPNIPRNNNDDGFDLVKTVLIIDAIDELTRVFKFERPFKAQRATRLLSFYR